MNVARRNLNRGLTRYVLPLGISVGIFVVCALFVAAPGMASEVERGQFKGAKTSVHPDWFKDSFLEFEDDIAEAAAEGKRLMLFFDQAGCPYCNKLIEDNFTDPDIEKKLKEKFDVVAINIWGDREVVQVGGRPFTEKTLAEAMLVQYTPTLLFFDEQRQVALRIDGYYSPDKFELALDYVSAHREKNQTFSEYITSRAETDGRPEGNIDIQGWAIQPPYQLDHLAAEKPIAIIFQEPGCEDCRLMIEKSLRDPAAAELIGQFHMVQLNRWDDSSMVTPSGARTTVSEWALEMGLSYLPTVIFFAEGGTEIMRVDSQLRTFHMLSTFDYVAQGRYRQAEPFQRFINERSEKLLEQGIDVDIWRY